MAKYQVQGPDGSTYEVEGPDDATEQQIIAEVQKQIDFSPKEKTFEDLYNQALKKKRANSTRASSTIKL